MISLEVNGTQFNNFTEAEANISLDTLAGSFRFVAVSKTDIDFPIKEGDSCRVIADGEAVITGFVDIVDGSYDTETHIINIEGRSKTADLIDSALEEAVDFLPPVTLQSLTEQVIAEADIDTIDVVVDVTIDAFGDGEVESSAAGEPIFDILEKYARKRQVLITTNADGDIVYTRGSGESSVATLTNNPAKDSNIKSARWRNDNSERFNKYFVRSQQNVSGLVLAGITKAADVVDQKSQVAIDDAIRDTRKLVINAESSSDKDQATPRAVWEANIRRTRSFSYSAIVQGHSHPEGVWAFNTLVNVDDIWARKGGKPLNDQLLINSLSFRFNLTEGSTTNITCVAADAYTVQASEPQKIETLEAGPLF